MNTPHRNTQFRGKKKKRLCPFRSLYAASGDMFKFLIWFIVAYLV